MPYIRQIISQAYTQPGIGCLQDLNYLSPGTDITCVTMINR